MALATDGFSATNKTDESGVSSVWWADAIGALVRGWTGALLVPAAHADHWAVLVAGSHTYGNYRHHADVAHAYQIAIKQGMSPDNIIGECVTFCASRARAAFDDSCCLLEHAGARHKIVFSSLSKLTGHTILFHAPQSYDVRRRRQRR